MNAIKTSAPQHFLLKVENHNPTVVAVSSDEMALVNRQIALEDERVEAGIPISQLFYCVRQIDDIQGLTRQALANLKVTPKQREGLNDIVRNLRRTGKRSIRPGYMMARWNSHRGRRVPAPVQWQGMETADLARHGKALEAKGLIVMSGVAYGPKTYSVTALGYAVADNS